MIIHGIVRAGQGKGRAFTQLDWVRRQFCDKLGFDPYPGTLNLHIEDRAALASLRTRQGSVIEPEEEGYCRARAVPVRVNGRIAAAWIIPDVPGYPGDVMELMAPVSLRDALKLKDGDSVRVEVAD
jgi:riboflavin kinase